MMLRVVLAKACVCVCCESCERGWSMSQQSIEHMEEVEGKRQFAMDATPLA